MLLGPKFRRVNNSEYKYASSIASGSSEFNPSLSSSKGVGPRSNRCFVCSKPPTTTFSPPLRRCTLCQRRYHPDCDYHPSSAEGYQSDAFSSNWRCSQCIKLNKQIRLKGSNMEGRSAQLYKSELPGDLQANHGRLPKRRKITEPPVFQSIETGGGDHLLATSDNIGKVDCLPPATGHNAVSQANPEPRVNDSSQPRGFRQLMTKAIKDPRLIYLIQKMAAGQASPTESAEFGRYTTIPGSTLLISGGTSVAKDEDQEAIGTVQTFPTTLGPGQDCSGPSNFGKPSLYNPQTKELSPPYSPPLDVGFRNVQPHTDAAVQVDIKLGPLEISSNIDHPYNNTIAQSIEEKSLDPATYRSLAVCGRCGKKILGATSQEGNVLLCSICKRSSNHAYTKAIHRPSFTKVPANDIVIPESPLVRPYNASADYPPYKATTNFRSKLAFVDPGIPGAGLFTIEKLPQDPLEVVDDGTHAERMDTGHSFAKSIQKTPNFISERPERPNPSSSTASFFPLIAPFTSNKAKLKDSSLSLRLDPSSKLDANEDGRKEHKLVESHSSQDRFIALKASEPSENADRAHSLESKKKLKSYEREINKLRGLLKNRKLEHLKHREKNERTLCDLQLQLDEMKEELEISRSNKDKIIKPSNSVNLKSLSEYEGIRKAYRRQKELARHKASQLEDANSEIEALKMQISKRERHDHKAEMASLRGQIEELEKRLSSTPIPQQKQRYCHRDLFAAAPELRPDRLLFDVEAKKAEIAARPSRKAQFGSVLANVRKERGMFPHREKNRYVGERSKKDQEVAVVIEKRKLGELMSNVSDSGFSTDDKAEESSTSEAILAGTRASRSNYEALTEHDEQMGIPKVVIPCLVDKQLAYRDGTRDTKGRLPRSRVTYKVGRDVTGQLR